MKKTQLFYYADLHGQVGVGEPRGGEPLATPRLQILLGIGQPRGQPCAQERGRLRLPRLQIGSPADGGDF